MGLKNTLSVLVKGIGMGAADVVPGISGGTIAFITGIYEKFVEGLNNVDLESVKMLFTGRWRSLEKRIHGFFLLTLMIGIFVSVFSFAKIITYLLEVYPVFVWSLFLGLILASVLVVIKKVKKWNFRAYLFFLIGCVTAFLLTVSSVMSMPNGHFYTFCAGFISIIAMVLPGISGSFLLVIIDKYEFIMNQISQISVYLKDIVAQNDSQMPKQALISIVFFYLGTLSGILSFAKILNWLFKRFYDLTISLLTGFMIGSFPALWPWKESVVKILNGKEKTIGYQWNIPHIDTNLFISIFFMVLGFFVVFYIEKVSSDKGFDEVQNDK